MRWLPSSATPVQNLFSHEIDQAPLKRPSIPAHIFLAGPGSEKTQRDTFSSTFDVPSLKSLPQHACKEKVSAGSLPTALRLCWFGTSGNLFHFDGNGRGKLTGMKVSSWLLLS